MRQQLAENKHFSKTMKSFSMFLAPLGIVILAAFLRHVYGPFWLGNLFEAEYTYLMNSLAVSQGFQAFHADHPGSTLQLFGAALLFAVHIITGKGGALVDDVLIRPEFYLSSIYYSLIFILFISILFAGLLSLRWTGNYAASLLLQLALILSYCVCYYALPRMKPELMILIIDVWLCIAVLYHYHLTVSNGEASPVFTYGVIVGIGVALKITYFPLMLLPLVLVKSIKDKISLMMISAFVFIAITANPLMNFDGFLGFLFGELFARKGYNRPIVEGSDTFQAMGQGISRLFHFVYQQEIVFVGIVVVFLISGIIYFLTRSWRTPSAADSFFRRCWLGLLLAVVCQFLLVANGPSAKSHYLIPAMGLIGLVALVSWLWPASFLRNNKRVLLLYQISCLSLFFGAFVWAGWKFPAQVNGVEKETERWLEASRYRKENNLLDIPTVYYYQASNIQYALAFGNEMSGRHFSRNLAALYPECYSFRLWNRVLYGSFGSETVKLNDIVNKYGRVLIQGGNAHPPVIAGLSMEDYPVERKKHYRISGVVIPAESDQSLSARVLYNGAREWVVLVEPAEPAI
jgi:hypothetical protein